MVETIRKQYDELSGLWIVEVYVTGDWTEVASHCDEEDADLCIKCLQLWRKT